ncbi:MAG: hypothetical protein ACTSW1_01225, partial [Candidatus Hodarchaeales archaeon]
IIVKSFYDESNFQFGFASKAPEGFGLVNLSVEVAIFDVNTGFHCGSNVEFHTYNISWDTLQDQSLEWKCPSDTTRIVIYFVTVRYKGVVLFSSYYFTFASLFMSNFYLLEPIELSGSDVSSTLSSAGSSSNHRTPAWGFLIVVLASLLLTRKKTISKN